jgi:hypothetical protein
MIETIYNAWHKVQAEANHSDFKIREAKIGGD